MTVTDTVIELAKLAALPLIFFIVAIPSFRGALWAGDKIGQWGTKDPFSNFREFRVWLSCIIYFTGAAWSLGLAVTACALYGVWMTEVQHG